MGTWFSSSEGGSASDEPATEKSEPVVKPYHGGRRLSVSAESGVEKRAASYVRPIHAKTEQEQLEVTEAIKNNDKASLLFSHLDEVALSHLVDAFCLMTFQQGQDIIKQGDEGDRFYIVREGEFEIFVARDDPCGTRSSVKVSVGGPQSSFGELALMYNAPRAATVTCSSEAATVWALDRESFQVLVMSAQAEKLERYEGWLQQVPLLQGLNHFELARLSDMLEQELFDEGEVIITEGEPGEKLYILEAGSLAVYKNGEQVLRYTDPGEYFGEVALYANTVRQATVKAETDAIVHSINKDDFEDVIGPISAVRQVLSHGMARYGIE